MWGEELKKYLVEIMKYERKRYEMNLAVLELKKKRGIYERMMGRYTAGETASWKKGEDCWKDKVRMAFAAAYARWICRETDQISKQGNQAFRGGIQENRSTIAGNVSG
jgi:hypothetical protein